MQTLVIGASGATGQRAVQQLLNYGSKVKVIVRPTANIPDSWLVNGVNIIKANISEMSIKDMAGHLLGCDAVVSCIGHNISWKGIYGKPRRLVANAVGLICDSIVLSPPNRPMKFVLMNTAGCINKDLNEQNTFAESMILRLLRILVPPHPDNEQALEYLRTQIGQDHTMIDWVAVRPDTLVDEPQVSGYSVHPSPTTSAIFNSGQSSRANVGDFIARLVIDAPLWMEWKGQMPVIYNRT